MDTVDVTGIDAQEVMLALDRVTFDGLVGAGVLLLLGLVVIRVVMQILRRVMARLPFDGTLTSFLSSGTKIVLYIVLGTMVADKLGFPVTSLVALLSLFALAISLSVQNVLANVVSGVVILTSKLFVAGDYIETDTAAGTVQSINLMHTHMVTPDNKVVLVPNSELSAGKITNYSANALRRVDIPVRVGYEYGNARVTAALMRAAQGMPDLERGEKAPQVLISEYGETGVKFILRVWTPTARYWDVYYALMSAVREALEEDGIPLTYGAQRVEIGGCER